MMARSTIQFRLPTLFIAMTAFAIALSVGLYFDRTGGHFMDGFLAAWGVFAAVGAFVYLAWFIVHDVLGLNVIVTKQQMCRLKSTDDSPGVTNEREAMARAKNEATRKWWRRPWWNRYRAYQPGKDYTFPSQFED